MSLHYYKDSTAASPYIDSDNFNDNSLDAGIWTSYTAGGGTVTEQNQRLEVSGDDGSEVWVYQTSVSGDFDVSVKIVSGVDWSTPGIAMNSSSWIIDCYVDADGLNGDINDDNNYITRPDYPFWVRIKRIGSVGYVYYKTTLEGDWILLNSGTVVTTTQSIYLYFYGWAATVYAYFDDFVNNIIGEVTNITLYASDSTSWNDSLIVRVDGANAYAQLDSNLSHTYATDLRVRADGVTYTVLSEEGTPTQHWFEHFDNSDWTAALGTWDTDHWDSADVTVWHILQVVVSGTWRDSYRPTKMRITYTGEPIVSITLTDSDSQPIGEYGGAGYISGTEIDLTFGSYDIVGLTCLTDSRAAFVVTNIEFYVP